MHPSCSWRIVDKPYSTMRLSWGVSPIHPIPRLYQGPQKTTSPHRLAALFVEVAADGEWMATGGGKQASIWRMPNCTVSSLEAGCVEEAGVSSGGQLGILGFQKNPFPGTVDSAVILVSRLDLCTFGGPMWGIYDILYIGTLSQDSKMRL